MWQLWAVWVSLAHMYSQYPTITTETTAWILAACFIVMLTSWTLGFYMMVCVLKKPPPVLASGRELEFLSLFWIARFQIFFLKGVCFLFHFCVSVCVCASVCDWEGLQGHTLCYRDRSSCDFSFPLVQCNCIGGPRAGALWIKGQSELWKDACMSLNPERLVKEATVANERCLEHIIQVKVRCNPKMTGIAARNHDVYLWM